MDTLPATGVALHEERAAREQAEAAEERERAADALRAGPSILRDSGRPFFFTSGRTRTGAAVWV